MTRMHGSDWDAIAATEELVFARTTPEHKMIVVEAMKKRGKVRNRRTTLPVFLPSSRCCLLVVSAPSHGMNVVAWNLDRSLLSLATA